MLTFSGLVCTLLTLQLPQDQVDAVVPPLMDAFGLPEDARAFIFDNYLPEVWGISAQQDTKHLV